MTSPTQAKHKTIEGKLHNATITRCVFDVESSGPLKGHARKHLRFDFQGGATVLITGQFQILYNDPPENGDNAEG